MVLSRHPSVLAGMHICTLSGLDWLGSVGTGGDRGLTEHPSVHRVPHQLEILDRTPDVLPLLLCELTLSKREQQSLSILLMEGKKCPGSTWTSGSSVRALIVRAQAKSVLCK